MLLDLLLLAASLGVLFLGAEGLVRGAASLALRLGLTPLVVGLTVVAFGTSMPEMVVSVNAAMAGQGDIAVGNVVGSNSFNIGVILGLAALVFPVRVALPVLRLDAPIMVFVAAFLLFFAWQGGIGRIEGVTLAIALVGYTAMNVILARKQATAEVNHEFEEGVPARSGNLGKDLLFILGGLGLLILGSRWLVTAAVSIARAFDISEAVIALTIIAAGTSMPELATSVMAAIRKQPDIAIGNVIGSNIFNILGILGVAAMVRPLTFPGIVPIDLLAMLAFSVLLVPMLWTSRTLQRIEGALLLAGYAAYVWARLAMP
jgi:cation:H+ antiporter